jgi:hypothetical protein
MRSETSTKPTMSANSTVTWRRSPKGGAVGAEFFAPPPTLTTFFSQIRPSPNDRRILQ